MEYQQTVSEMQRNTGNVIVLVDFHWSKLNLRGRWECAIAFYEEGSWISESIHWFKYTISLAISDLYNYCSRCVLKNMVRYTKNTIKYIVKSYQKFSSSYIKYELVNHLLCFDFSIFESFFLTGNNLNVFICYFDGKQHFVLSITIVFSLWVFNAL